MKNLIALAVFLVLAFFFFLGYHWARKDYERDMEQWREKTKTEIREELKAKAKKNYENYIRINGIDSMSYAERVEWFMSNSAYE